MRFGYTIVHQSGMDYNKARKSERREMKNARRRMPDFPSGKTLLFHKPFAIDRRYSRNTFPTVDRQPIRCVDRLLFKAILPYMIK